MSTGAALALRRLTDSIGSTRSMVNFMDGAVGNITDLLKSKGMWDDTIIFFQSDNGGPSYAGSSHTANNWPLMGTKMHNWEGRCSLQAHTPAGTVHAESRLCAVLPCSPSCSRPSACDRRWDPSQRVGVWRAATGEVPAHGGD